MSRTSAFLIVLCWCVLSTATAWGQHTAEGLISENEVRRFGLERAWVTQVELDPARGRVTNLTAYVSVSDITTVFNVYYEDGLRRTFSQHDLDRFGRVLGKEGAKQEAEAFAVTTVFDVQFDGRRRTFSERDLDRFGGIFGKEGAKHEAAVFVAELKKRKQEAEVKERKLEGKIEKVLIPDTSLYVTSDRAIVHAIDAETGATRWAELVGNGEHPTECPAASEPYVAILNGSDLYLLKRKTGEIIWKRRIRGVPGAGASITNDYVVVPTISGSVEFYSIKETRTLPEMYKCNGRVLVHPLTTPQVVAWPTDRGFLYVARANKKGLRYRHEAKDAIVCQASYCAPNYIFTASIDGYVYCLHELTGNEIWLFSTGEAISNTPVPVGANLYVVTDKGSLFCIEIETGQSKWISSGFRSFLAASQDRVYCLGDSGRLIIVDAKTGGRIASLGTQALDLFYTNLQTDRIYLGTKTGLLMCLRETNRVRPLVHAGVIDPDEVKKAEAATEEAGEQDQTGDAKPAKGKPVKGKPAEAKPQKQPAAAGGATPPDADKEDPFGAGGNGAEPLGDGKDEKPAAGGKDDQEPDPFGAGAAPVQEDAKEDAGGAKDPLGGGGADDPFK